MTHTCYVQLLENFRLQEDLSAFVQLIYPRRFKPQKRETRRFAEALERHIQATHSLGLAGQVQDFFRSLSQAMLSGSSKGLQAPLHTRSLTRDAESGQSHLPIALAMLDLSVSSARGKEVAIEQHINAEAAVAAELVRSLVRQLIYTARQEADALAAGDSVLLFPKKTSSSRRLIGCSEAQSRPHFAMKSQQAPVMNWQLSCNFSPLPSHRQPVELWSIPWRSSKGTKLVSSSACFRTPTCRQPKQTCLFSWNDAD